MSQFQHHPYESYTQQQQQPVVRALRGAAAKEQIASQPQSPGGGGNDSFTFPKISHHGETRQFDTAAANWSTPTVGTPPFHQSSTTHDTSTPRHLTTTMLSDENDRYAHIGVNTDKGYFAATDSQVSPEKSLGTRSPAKRSRHRFCGCCCCGGRLCAVITLVLLIILGTAGYFLWPRFPGVQVDAVEADSSPPENADVPANGFSLEPGRFAMSQSIAVNLTAYSPNFVPWHFNSVTIEVKDRANNQVLGEAAAKDVTLAPQDYTHATLRGRVHYRTANATDPTWRRLVLACSGSRTDVPVRLIIQVDVPVIKWFTTPSFEQPAVWKCPSQVTVQDPLSS